MRKNTFDPIFSNIDLKYLPVIEKIPEVKVAMPELWRIATSTETTSVLMNGLMDSFVILGIDIQKYQQLSENAIHKKRFNYMEIFESRR